MPLAPLRRKRHAIQSAAAAAASPDGANLPVHPVLLHEAGLLLEPGAHGVVDGGDKGGPEGDRDGQREAQQEPEAPSGGGEVAVEEGLGDEVYVSAAEHGGLYVEELDTVAEALDQRSELFEALILNLEGLGIGVGWIGFGLNHGCSRGEEEEEEDEGDRK